jgi:hypothetical protein
LWKSVLHQLILDLEKGSAVPTSTKVLRKVGAERSRRYVGGVEGLPLTEHRNTTGLPLRIQYPITPLPLTDTANKRRDLLNNRGITLATAVLLIIMASVAVLGLTTFIIENITVVDTKRIRSNSQYLAQAGLHDVLYNFRSNDLTGTGYFTLGQTNIDADNYFVIGGTEADLLMVDTSNAFLGGTLTPGQCKATGRACNNDCKDVQKVCDDQCDADWQVCRDTADADKEACRAACPPGPSGNACRQACNDVWQAAKVACDAVRDACKNACFDIWKDCNDECLGDEEACIDGTKLIDAYFQNATNSQTITIDRMIVTWQNSLNLEEIRIDGTLVWLGSLPSPADADLNPNFTLDTIPTNYLLDYLRFSGNMDGAAVDVRFVMTDGSTRDVPFFPASNNFNFTLKSSGKTTGSNIYRTLEAEYNTLTEKIINYYEVNTEITP